MGGSIGNVKDNSDVLLKAAPISSGNASRRWNDADTMG